MLRHRQTGSPAPSGAWKAPVLGALALAAALVCATRPSLACQSSLTGRTVTVEADFGTVQGLPPLPLGAGEYAVTIDDGPNPRTTPELLDVLDRACAKATFFLIGKHARENPDLVKEILSRGHTIGSHSFSHPDLRKLDGEEIARQIDLGVKWVDQSAYGAMRAKGTPRLLRFPGSSGPTPVTSPDLIEMAHERGLTVAGYDISPEDWRNAPPRESLERLLSRLGDRGVIVFHDGQPNTIALLPMALEEMKRRGARVVALNMPTR